MSLSTMLNLKNSVQVRRMSESYDGLGGISSSTTLTTLSKASIWTVDNAQIPMSEKLVNNSTHVLAIMHGDYTFTDADRELLYGGVTYTINGHMDDVAERNRLVLMGLNRQS